MSPASARPSAAGICSRFESDVAFTDHGRGHVGEGREITGSADGALFRNDRDHAFFQHGFDQADEFRAHTGSAAAERDQLQRHDHAHDIFRQRVTDAAAMGQDEIALQRSDIRRIDPDRGKFAEPGIDAIDRRIPGGDFGNSFRCRFDAGMKGRIELCRRAMPVDRLESGKRHCARDGVLLSSSIMLSKRAGGAG